MKLSNLDKIYWKKEKISKGELLEYYKKIARIILPYLKDRPLTMHRFPNGISGQSFFQKEAPENTPSFVKTATVQHTEKKLSYIVVQNANTLLYVANLGSIELHPFSSRLKNLEKPDYVVFDLDRQSVSFEKVIETALVLHELLEKLNVPSFCKTTGGKGLHVYVPLKGKYKYQEARQFAQKVARVLHEQIPSFTSLERTPAKRRNKVYIDCLQNVKGHTLVCPYSVRGMPGATVSTPLSWKEVKKGLNPQSFTIKTVPKRISQKGDIFKGILSRGANLKTALKKLESLKPNAKRHHS